jgi:hypothetical protein
MRFESPDSLFNCQRSRPSGVFRTRYYLRPIFVRGGVSFAPRETLMFSRSGSARQQLFFVAFKKSFVRVDQGAVFS